MSDSITPKECCAKGFRYEGATAGKIIDFNGVETYVVGDESLKSKRVLIVWTDILGHKVINNQLLADQFAEAGYYVVMPDLFENDAIPLNPPASFSFADWLPNHTIEIATKFVDAVLSEVESWKPAYLTAVGYCYGAKFVVQQLGSKRINAGGVCHPSFLTIEDVKAIKRPILIAGAEIDNTYNDEFRAKTEAALVEIKATYFITRAAKVSHGFSVRGDPSDPFTLAMRKKAFCDIVWWFDLFSNPDSAAHI